MLRSGQPILNRAARAPVTLRAHLMEETTETSDHRTIDRLADDDRLRRKRYTDQQIDGKPQSYDGEVRRTNA